MSDEKTPLHGLLDAEHKVLANFEEIEPSKSSLREKAIVLVGAYLVIVPVTVVCYKLVMSQSSLDLATFNFSDLLSLLLALFSVALSSAFYFKASDTSNEFYQNSYKFTKEVSEILGRIEERFGERLRHIDEGYSELKTNLGCVINSKEAVLHDFGDVYKKIEESTKSLTDDIINQIGEAGKKEKDRLIININDQMNLIKQQLDLTKERTEEALGAFAGISPREEIVLRVFLNDSDKSFSVAELSNILTLGVKSIMITLRTLSDKGYLEVDNFLRGSRRFKLSAAFLKNPVTTFCDEHGQQKMFKWI
ncbi:MAG: hypothetical protein AB9873_00640 [Syntrophobacteraceae bacterium]